MLSSRRKWLFICLCWYSYNFVGAHSGSRIALPVIACAESLAKTAACVELTSVSINGFRGNRLMLVLRTNGCYFDKGETGCTMCNFREHAIDPRQYRVTHNDLMTQLEQEL